MNMPWAGAAQAGRFRFKCERSLLACGANWARTIRMKLSFPFRAALVALSLSIASAIPSPAQTPAPSTNATATLRPPMSVLDNDETVHLQKVREQVLAANPDLKAEEEKLKTMHDSAANQPPPTPEQKNAMFAEWKAYQKKMRAAILAIDPTLAPVFAKLDAARKNGTAPTPFAPASK